MSAKIYWFKKLSIPDICLFIARNIFSCATAYYDEEVITPRTRKFLQWLSRIGLGRRLLPATLDFNAKDEHGRSLVYPTTDNLNQLSCWCLSAYWPEATEREKQMFVTYLRGHIDDQIKFITLVAERIKHRDEPDHVLYIDPGPMSSMIARFFATQGVIIRTSCGLAKNLPKWLGPFVYLYLVLLAAFFPRKENSSVTTVRPAVWVEFYEFGTFKQTFWRQHLHNPNFDVVYYLDRDDTPFTWETAAAIEKGGMKWVDAHLLPIINMSRLAPRKAWHFLLEYIFPSGSLPSWFRVFRFEERFWGSVYESVFKRYQVKILFQHQDRSWKQAVQAKAMEAAGGIMIGYHWSNLPYCMEHHFLTSQHVFFVWGRAMRTCLENIKNTCNHILPCGIWLKPGDSQPEELGNFAKDLNFIFSIFDSDVGHYQMQTPKTLSNFFLRLLSILEEHNNWGGILKAKFSSPEQYADILPRGREIVDRMSILQKQGRLVIIPPKYSPITAMAHSHLGVCYCFNSAGVVSAIYGYRAIHWECVGQDNPIYSDPKQQILYKSLDDLESAILRAASGDETIGDFSKWQKSVNYFGDYEGDKRVAWFVQNFMDSITCTNDYKKSIDDSVERYIARYHVGKDFLP